MNNFIPTLKYFLLTIKHKWFVFLAGRKLKVNIFRLIIHDWSKFLPSELPHYGRQFFGKADNGFEFALCWARHQNRHEHHWEYWVPRTGHNRSGFCDNEPLMMSSQAVREMVANWMGASRAYEGKWPDTKNWTWVKNNVPTMNLNPETKNRIKTVIKELKNV